MTCERTCESMMWPRSSIVRACGGRGGAVAAVAGASPFRSCSACVCDFLVPLLMFRLLAAPDIEAIEEVLHFGFFGRFAERFLQPGNPYFTIFPAHHDLIRDV